MTTFRDYRKESRFNWGRDTKEGENLTIEQINCGAMMRIADATEAMAKNHVQLQADYDFMRRSRDSYRAECEQLRNTNRTLRGVITKLKKKSVKNQDVKL